MDGFSNTPKLKPITKKSAQANDAASNTAQDRAAYDGSFNNKWAGQNNNFNTGFNFNNPCRFRPPPPQHYFNYPRPEFPNQYRQYIPPPQNRFSWSKNYNNYQWNNYQNQDRNQRHFYNNNQTTDYHIEIHDSRTVVYTEIVDNRKNRYSKDPSVQTKKTESTTSKEECSQEHGENLELKEAFIETENENACSKNKEKVNRNLDIKESSDENENIKSSTFEKKNKGNLNPHECSPETEQYTSPSSKGPAKGKTKITIYKTLNSLKKSLQTNKISTKKPSNKNEKQKKHQGKFNSEKDILNTDNESNQITLSEFAKVIESSSLIHHVKDPVKSCSEANSDSIDILDETKKSVKNNSDHALIQDSLTETESTKGLYDLNHKALQQTCQNENISAEFENKARNTLKEPDTESITEKDEPLIITNEVLIKNEKIFCDSKVTEEIQTELENITKASSYLVEDVSEEHQKSEIIANEKIFCDSKVTEEIQTEFEDITKASSNLVEEASEEHQKSDINVETSRTKSDTNPGGSLSIKLVPLEKLLDPNLSDNTGRTLNSELKHSHKNNEDEKIMNRILSRPMANIKKIINEKSRYDGFLKSLAEKRSLKKAAAEHNKRSLSDIFRPDTSNDRVSPPANTNQLVGNSESLEEKSISTQINTSNEIENSIESVMLSDSILIIDSSSSSGSDADSDDSNACAERRHQLHKSVAEGNVISSFEKLILPNIREGLQKSYKNKFSNNIANKLHFISCICTSEYNSVKFSKYEIAQIQRNIHFKDNSLATDFLKKQIEQVFSDFDKPKRKLKKSKPENEGDKCTSNTLNQCVAETNATQNKSVDVAEKVNADEHHNKKQMESTLSENQNETSNVFNKLEEKNTTTTATTTKDNELRDNESQSFEPPHRENLKVEDANKNNDNEQSDGEGDEESEALQKNNNQMPSQLLATIQKIDMHLIDLRRRELFIDEMITKLQKDKIEANLMVTELEKQKYMLLNSMITSQMQMNNENKKLVNNLNVDSNQISRKRKRKADNNNLHLHKKMCINETLSELPTKSSDFEEVSGNKPDEAKIQKQDVNSANKTENSVKEAKSLQKINEENILISVPEYSDIATGIIENFKGLVVSTIDIIDSTVLAGTESGDVLEYDVKEQKLKNKYRKHSETVTKICFSRKDQLMYTISLDGFFKITNLNNLQIDVQSVHLREPLQSIDCKWDTAYIGSRWGNIYTYDLTTCKINVTPLCSSTMSITAVKAIEANDGRRSIIVAGRSPEILFRDARNGSILRTIRVTDHINVYSIFLDGESMYCLTQKKEIFKFNLANGNHLATTRCGNGAVSMVLYKKRYLLVGSYDGFIYVMDKETNQIIEKFTTTGRVILAMAVLGDKILTSTKTKGMQILDIPKHIVVKAMESATNT